MNGMSIDVRLTALYLAWLAATLAETRELAPAPAGVNVDGARGHQRWHCELPLPQPVLMASPPPPPPPFQPTQQPAWHHWNQTSNWYAQESLRTQRRQMAAILAAR